MKYKEVKKHYDSGQLKRHYFIDESGRTHGEYRRYHENGQLHWHYFNHINYDYGEAKLFNKDGTLYHHYLKDGKGNEIATVIDKGKPSTHSDEELIQIAKDNNLPLLSELPKTEAELTHWNLKHPTTPYLPIEST